MKKIIAFLIVVVLTGALCAKVTASSKAGGKSAFSTRTYQLSDFTNIQVNNVVKVIYTQGDKYEVKLTGRTDWLDLMEVTSKGGTLKVHSKSDKKFKNVKAQDQPDGHHNFILHLTAPCLQNINISGVSSFEGKRITPDWLSVCLEGVSKFNVEAIECASMRLRLNGVSKMDVADIKCQQKFDASIEGSSKADIQHIKAKEVYFSINGASKADLPDISQGEKATINVGGASKLSLSAEMSGLMQVGFSGASKGELTYKGGDLRTFCTGASKLNAEVNCKGINATCDGASKTYFSGTADKVEIDRSGVAVNIDTSRLNQF